MRKFLILLLMLALSACKPQHALQGSTESQVVLSSPEITSNEPVTAIIHGNIITGTGDMPMADGVILIQGNQIVYVGSVGSVEIPSNAIILDAQGDSVLPGFINTHIHRGFSKNMLEQHLQGGVTTVRDESTSYSSLKESIALRNSLKEDASLARLVSAGAMMTVPAGYGELYVATVDEAISRVNDELDLGVDQIKISLEDGYAGQHNLPKLTPEQMQAIVHTAHAREARVSGHITQAAYIPAMLDAGVDDIAHLAWDPIPPDTIRQMVNSGVYLIPTFTVFRNYNAPLDQCVANLKAYVEAGGLVALGNDYGGGPGDFETGIPMYEIEMMQKAGMSPIQIIEASTKNAAVVLGMQNEIGTLEEGKQADIIIVAGNPLEDLSVLRNLKLIVHAGQIIPLE